MNEPFAFYEKTAEYVKSRAPFAPELGLILGTGLGPLAKQIENPVEIDYRDIPNFLVSTAPDHAGKLIFGTLEGKKLVCMSGRFHSYEGYDFEQLAIPVRLFKLLGVKQLIVTNAAGGVNERYRPGDIMVISDHIKLNGASPMRGKNLPEFGDRFFDVSRMYTPRLRVWLYGYLKIRSSASMRACISSCRDRSLKRRQKSAPSGCLEATRSACRRSPRRSQRRTAE